MPRLSWKCITALSLERGLFLNFVREKLVVIPPQHPHIGDWEKSSEVVVLLISPVAFERPADEILAQPKFEIREQNLDDEPLVHLLCSSIVTSFALASA